MKAARIEPPCSISKAIFRKHRGTIVLCVSTIFQDAKLLQACVSDAFTCKQFNRQPCRRNCIQAGAHATGSIPIISHTTRRPMHHEHRTGYAHLKGLPNAQYCALYVLLSTPPCRNRPAFCCHHLAHGQKLLSVSPSVVLQLTPSDANWGLMAQQ